MNTEEFFKSVYFKRILTGLVILILLLLSFRLGILVGFNKAQFSLRWGENYARNFGAPRGMSPWENFPGLMRGDFPDRDLINPHGTAGTVLKVESGSLIIRGRDNIEKNILISSSTPISKFRNDIKLSDIKPDDLVTIIGEPNEQGQIIAKFVRVFDKPK